KASLRMCMGQGNAGEKPIVVRSARVVSYVSSLENRIQALVHDSVRQSPFERSRHALFIGTRLIIALVAAVSGPICLALNGAPPLWQSLAFALAMVPLLAVVVVSRTGLIELGHVLCICALSGLAMTISFGAGANSSAAIVWLVLTPLEAALSLAPGMVALSAISALVICALMNAAQQFGLAPPAGADAGADLLFSAVAVLYALGLAGCWLRLSELRRRRERVDAARYATLSEALGDLVLRFDRTGAVFSASRECEALFSLNARSLMGRGFFERIQVADRPAFLKVIADAAASQQTAVATVRLRTSSTASERGAYEEPLFVWVEIRARNIGVEPSLREDGAVVVAVVRDVSERVESQRAIEAARLETERAQGWKDRFLANVSHELRTPLNAIIGFSEMLGNEQLAPRDEAKRREYADIINTSGLHLLSVVNSILDMSKIESGSFEVVAEPFDVAPLIDSCCDMVRLKAEESRVEIVRVCPANLDELIADKRACKQILINLLSNAVKFTPSGGRVTVGVRPEGNSLALYVADTGIGITAPDLPRLGDPFFQARSSYDRPYEGTGLGLSVVKGLVGLHGGTISLESEPGQGTCVTVRLPLDCRRVVSLGQESAKIEVITRATHASSAFPMVKKIA
ncbi:MAG: sensor histidine kinase, partial [Hyphomicrobiales bacterium]|nr:sensor histidine kinase [Hyphomicrobiales bacterium]